MKMASKTTIETLNNDCLISIFEYLTIKEKLQLELVNKRWNQVAKLSWSCVKNLEVCAYKSFDSERKNKNFLINRVFICPSFFNKEKNTIILRLFTSYFDDNRNR